MPQRRRKKKTVQTYFSGFHTTVLVFQRKGMTMISGCCLDSGYNDYGCRAMINPSAAEALDLGSFRSVRRSILANGSEACTEHSMHVPLTFVTYAGLITINAIVDIRQQDSDGDSMLLSTGILNALGGMHDHSTNPSTFIVTNNNTGLRELLQSDHGELPIATWYPKDDPGTYIDQLVSVPCFAIQGTSAFPKLAFDRIGTSRDVYYWCNKHPDWRSFGLHAMAVVHKLADDERNAYGLMMEDLDGPPDTAARDIIQRAVDKQFEPEPSPWYMPRDDVAEYEEDWNPTWDDLMTWALR